MTMPASDSRAAALEPPGGAAPMADGLDAAARRLDDLSDWISPIVVKEVRQIVQGREFFYSFLAMLGAGLIVSFVGATWATAGTGTTGRWVFTALMACLAALGVLVVPLGAFSALRNERLEQTMDLITVTALSPRRVVIGKLLAQGVKLATLFAGMGPFVATSFLLGGIDFATILVALALVFLGSLWVCGAALLLASIPRTRALWGMLFAGAGVVVVLPFGARFVYLILFTALAGGGGIAMFGAPVAAGGALWWVVGGLAAAGLVSLTNLVLLAENRLSSPVEDKATALRIGFLAQFLTLAGIFLAVRWFAPGTAAVAAPIAAICGTHLAIVAAFTVTEDFAVSRRVLVRAMAARWRWLNAVLRPGGGRGALYVLAQMALLVAIVRIAGGTASDLRWTLALCGYICLVTGVPALVLRRIRPAIPSWQLRIAILVLLSASLVLPDLVYYFLWQPETFDYAFTTRHLVNPLRTLANWPLVEGLGDVDEVFALGVVGVASYAALIWMNRRVTRRQERAHQEHTGAEDAGHAAAY